MRSTNSDSRRAPDGRRQRRLRTPIAVCITTALVCGGGLAGAAGLEPETPPKNYRGEHRLFMNNLYVGALHSFSGCSTEVRDRRTSTGPQPQRTEPECVLEIGTAVTAEFRERLVAMATGRDSAVLQDFTIGPAVETAKGFMVNRELRFRGAISQFTLPSTQPSATSAPGWLEVRLRPDPTSRVQRWTTAGRIVPPAVDVPFETSSARVSLGGTSLPSSGVDPITVSRAIAESGPDIEATRPRIDGDAIVRMPDDGKIANEVATWFNDRAAKGISTDRMLRVLYPGRSGGSIDLSFLTRPVSFDPYARTDGFRRLRLAPGVISTDDDGLNLYPRVDSFIFQGAKF